MPKKTRRQKILSDRHKKTISSALTYAYSPSPNPAKTVEVKSIDSLETYALIKKDIYKTVIIAGFFLLIEIIVSIYSKKIGW